MNSPKVFQMSSIEQNLYERMTTQRHQSYRYETNPDKRWNIIPSRFFNKRKYNGNMAIFITVADHT